MQIRIDFRSGVPIYAQIMEQIRQQVASGELKLGDQLPTVRQLATELRVNWNTVARAYRLLDEAGLISTQQGRGTYVWEAPSPESAELLRHETPEGITQRYLAAVAQLGYTPEEVATALVRYMAAWKEGDPPQAAD